jgi:hypothetical protein
MGQLSGQTVSQLKETTKYFLGDDKDVKLLLMKMMSWNHSEATDLCGSK